MALKVAGVRLVAEGYQQYISQIQNINRLHAQSFQAKPIQTFRKETKAAEQGASLFARGMQVAATAAKALAIALVTVKLKEFAAESAMIAARNETLAVVLRRVGENAGYSAAQTAYAVEAVKDMGITTSSATQSLIRMAQAEIEWAHASELSRIAQDAAVIANINSSEAFERLIYGIQTGYSRILRTMGITVNFTKAYQDHSKTINKTVQEMEDYELVQARVNAVVKAASGITGAYEEAMGTVGKQMTSLPRYIEEAKAAWGELFKPILQTRVELETNFWKALGEVGKGLQASTELVNLAKSGFDAMRESLGLLIDDMMGIEESSTIWQELAHVLHDAAGGFADVVAYFSAGFATIREAAYGATEALIALFSGDLVRLGEVKKAWAQWDWSEVFQENLRRATAYMKEAYPTLYTPFEELGDVAEVSLEKAASAAERAADKIKAEMGALQERANVVKEAIDIERKWRRSLADEAERYAEEQIEFNREMEQQEIDLARQRDQDLRRLTEQAAQKELQIVEDYNRRRVQDERQRNLELEQERRRFELQQLQSQRQFELDQTRLAAAGDILGLIRLREDQALREQEEQENRGLTLREEQETWDERRRQEKEDYQTRIADLRQETERRRQEIMDSYRLELVEMQRAQLEARQEMQKAHEERLADIHDMRDRSLQDLGWAMAEEKKLHEDGAREIGDILAEAFGDAGVSDAIMQGFYERTSVASAEAFDAMISDVEAYQRAIDSLLGGGTSPTTGGVSGPTTRPSAGRRVRRYRSGGGGVVTGPATFEVEPGVTEAFSFMPLAMPATVDVRMSGGFDIRGADRASAGIVDAAVGQMIEAFEVALEQIKARRIR